MENTQEPTAVGTRTGDSSSQLQNTLSHISLACPWILWGVNDEGGAVGIFIPIFILKTIFAGAFYKKKVSEINFELDRK